MRSVKSVSSPRREKSEVKGVRSGGEVVEKRRERQSKSVRRCVSCVVIDNKAQEEHQKGGGTFPKKETPLKKTLPPKPSPKKPSQTPTKSHALLQKAYLGGNLTVTPSR